MRAILGLIFNRWVFAALGLAAIGLLIWFAGPLIAVAEYRPLESEQARAALIGLIIVLILARMIWRWIKARNANAQLSANLAAPAPAQAAPPDDVSAEEVAALQKRFAEAIDVLKQVSRSKPGIRSLLPGRQYLYDQPWYIFIGAPGSGKTTALINSGLKFPLGERLGVQKIRGVGGTRNCDWWFTDEAVLVDTAGRYTTQDSSEDLDKGAWSGFLRLLKKYRPRRPINGVIVTFSAADLLQQSGAETERHAVAVGARIQELHDQLGIRFPVYVLITKTDLLPGFMEFFGEYGREDRAQVWGVSFPLDEKDGGASQGSVALQRLGAELARLEARLNQRLVDRLQDERDAQKRGLIYAFPQQFALLKESVKDFLALILEPSQYRLQPMVRGVYFISGTQEGSPVDRIMGQLARAFHLEHRLLPPNTPTGKAFFITRLIKDVIFPEAGLAGTNIRLERRRVVLEWAALMLATIVTLGSIAAWAISYSRNKAYIAAVETQVKAVSEQVRPLQSRPTPDVVALLPPLRALQELAASTNAQDATVPLSMRFFLYQGDKLGAAANEAYRRLLREAFLPRLQARMEEQLRTRSQQNPEQVYEALKAYMMLSDPQHFNADALKSFIVADWDATLPRDVTVPQRKELVAHLNALLRQGAMVSPIIPDAQLVTDAREAIARTSLPQRIYNRLKTQDVGAKLPEFTVARAVGPNALRAFARESGQPLTKGVPGIFSFDGYYKAFVPAAERAAQQMADEEPWVIGVTVKEAPKLTDLRGTGQLLDDVKRLYLEDYARIWERFVNDIRVIRTGTLQQTIELTGLLSGMDSPFIPLMQAIVKEVTLLKVPEADKDIVTKTTDKVKKTGADVLKVLRDKTGQPATATPSGRPLEAIVDDRFDDLRRAVQSPAPGKPAPIESEVAMIGDLYTVLSANKAAITGKTAVPRSDVPMKIKTDAGRMPEPLRSAMATLAKDGVNNTANEAGKTIDDSLKVIRAQCQEAVGGRYPFVKTSDRDVTPDDFVRVFAAGGLMDDFFQKNLAPRVDATTERWTYRQVDDATIGNSAEYLLPFQRAQKIRDVFFAGGSRTPTLKLEFKPLEMDASIIQFTLDIDGQVIKYGHGPQVATPIQWPGPKGSMQVRMQLSPARAGGSGSGKVFEGPWALFRMLDGAKIDATGRPEKFLVTFDLDGRPVQFEIVTHSVQNPFRLPELEQFRCPDRL